ncbi:MAG TPA: VOC family protein [Solirubrobacteraceae bacterium]|jgi:catechol 2,3-dioxygenase-like lactoylglutathione lyase family enzyme|nr:VOC family protein [Solirubrobacteraceae bacterium]
MEIEFVSGVAVIAPDPAQSRRLYVDTLGLPLTSQGGDYFHSEHIPGTKHFGVWPLSQAAQACFGNERWPAHLAVPQVSVEFDVADAARVQDAADELVAAGYELLHPARQEPWGQTVARLLSPEGAIVGISFVPSMHE